jgi:hypothetical protein
MPGGVVAGLDLGGPGRAMDGLLEAEAGQTLLAALDPLIRPATAQDTPAAANAPPTPSPNWPAAASRGAGCPGSVGSGPS